jgi:RHS repeat-associated protein
MAGLLSALLLSVGLGSVTPPPPALPTISAPAAPSSLADSVVAPAFAPSAADPHLAVPYFGARYYSAPIARFTTVDPAYTWRENLVDPQRWNRYAYARNNPLRYIDPDGRETVSVIDGRMYGLGTEVLPPGTVEQGNQALGVLIGIAALGLPDPTDVALAPIAVRLGRLAGRVFGKWADDVVDVLISHEKSPRAARHIDDAQAAGKPDVVTLDRTRTRPNRQESLKGTEPQKGLDRDEYPPACCAEGGAGASVRPIPSGDNRSAGAQLGRQIKNLPDGTRIRIKTTDQ